MNLADRIVRSRNPSLIYSTKNKAERTDETRTELKSISDKITSGSVSSDAVVEKKKYTKRATLEANEEQFNKTVSSLRTGIYLLTNVANNFVKYPTPTVQFEAEFLADSLEMVLKKHKESLIDKMPELILGSAVLLWTVPRMIKVGEKKDEPENVNSNGNDGKREKQVNENTMEASSKKDNS
jgi:hypothetical protein